VPVGVNVEVVAGRANVEVVASVDVDVAVVINVEIGVVVLVRVDVEVVVKFDAVVRGVEFEAAMTVGFNPSNVIMDIDAKGVDDDDVVTIGIDVEAVITVVTVGAVAVVSSGSVFDAEIVVDCEEMLE
jgi:hypothetical protein